MVAAVRKSWNVNSAMAEARSYSARGKFGELSPGAYAFLKKFGMLTAACSHMIPVHNDYAREMVMEEAKKHTTRTSFLDAYAGGWCHARRHGYLEDACAHMVVKRRKWTVESVTKEALKYKTKSELLAGCMAAYSFAHSRKLLDVVCAHMQDHVGNKHDRQSVLATALKYKSRSEFRRFEPGAYQYAAIRGMTNEACSHMRRAGGSAFDFNKPAVVYCIKFTMPNGDQIYKVGITNRTARQRLTGVGTHSWTKATILREVPFATGLEARAKEKALHAALSEFRYAGPPIMGNGNTELFSRDATNYL